jgi:hypothetical protein
MILPGHAKPLQMFLPFVYDMKSNETFFDKVSKGTMNLLIGCGIFYAVAGVP